MQPVEHRFAIGDRVSSVEDFPHLRADWVGEILEIKETSFDADFKPSKESKPMYLCQFDHNLIWLFGGYLKKIEQSEQGLAPISQAPKKSSRKKLNITGGQQ